MLCVHTPVKKLTIIRKMMRLRTYSELMTLESFDDRYDYLRLGGGVGVSTFGFDRYINQSFYKSNEWKSARRRVIARDSGCDLGVPGFEIYHGLLVHHINPIDVNDIVDYEDWIVNPEYLITTCQHTHNAIHYGDKKLLKREPTPRRAGDTKLW